MKNLINELKRRNVFRVAPTYAVVAWIMGQGAGLILPTFEAPDWVLKVWISLLLIGFPVVIILTWAYELTPEGLRRTPAREEDSESAGHARLLDSVIIIVLVIALASITALNAGVSDGTPMLGPQSSASERHGEAPGQRIAVMPLVGVSTDSGTELLAHGLTSELIYELRRRWGLSVIGVASSFSYVGNKTSLEDIGRQLNVAHVVQGSVRRNDGRISIDIQLVAVPDGKELWSAEYERDRGHLRKVVDSAVAGLGKSLGAGRNESPAPDADGVRFSGIYEDWLTLLGHLQTGASEDLIKARVIAQRLTAQEPKLGQAFAALALAGFSLAETTNGDDQRDPSSKPNALLDQALTLAPQSERVLLWRAMLKSRMSRWRGRIEDFRRISEHFRHALELFPGQPALLTAFAEHCASWGEYERALDLSRGALELDPRSAAAHATQIEALTALGRYDAAEGAAREMAEVLPGSKAALRLQAKVFTARGQIDRALAELEKIAEPTPASLRTLTRIHASRQNISKALDALARWPDDSTEILERDIWRTALEEDASAAHALAKKELGPLRTVDAALLGRLSVQTGHHREAVEHFSDHFGDWLEDSGPLLGEPAWVNAPWFAFALREVGRGKEARRLLDRHLAGLVQMEGRLAPAVRDLYLAANYAGQSRETDAVDALQRALGHGLRLTWSALGAPIPLGETVILGKLPQDPDLRNLLSRLDPRNAAQGSASERNSARIADD